MLIYVKSLTFAKMSNSMRDSKRAKNYCGEEENIQINNLFLANV